MAGSTYPEIPDDLLEHVRNNPRSMVRYFLGLSETVQHIADKLKSEGHGELSLHHPILAADQLEYVARHLRTFAVHPDCLRLEDACTMEQPKRN